ncbi:uncharacterized protein KY384_008566 [Bacidia gigantensis]|uniref:uncharacterized protein n=1 Tax=Bacidia gigantensis TaxID=2732470 RepID=UPI001D0406F3|nr:uncharacterized protein KY384_008566 [Bacidia gigantensis]KAG8527137.1 hypothetical protein KY384_008566 [Bacidia gigantensis]
MVTLIGFLFIIGNVGLLELYIPDLVGPGLVLASLLMAASGYWGPETWHKPISSLVGLETALGDYSLIDIWIPLLVLMVTGAHIPACVYNVVKARRARNEPVAPVFFEWIPFFVFALATGSWLYSPYSTLLKENHLVLFCLTMSFVFGRMTTKIILAHLTRQPFPYWTVMLIPLIGGGVLVNLPPLLAFPPVSAITELWYLRAYFVFALVAYFRWALLVTGSICEYLDINCLTITPRLLPPQATGKDKKVNGGPPSQTPRRSGRLTVNGAAKGD